MSTAKDDQIKRIEMMRNIFFDKIYVIFGEENINNHPMFFAENMIVFAASLFVAHKIPEEIAQGTMLNALNAMYCLKEYKESTIQKNNNIH